MELLDRFSLPGVSDGGALALDDGEREAVDEHDDVGDDVLLRPEHLVLAGNDPLVAIRLVEVEESDRVALAPFAAVLFEGDAVGERGVERLVGFGEAGGGDLGHRLDGLGDVGVGEPGVQALERRGEAVGEDGFLEARALGFEVFGRDVGVAEGLEQIDRGIFREVELVPAGCLRAHAASVSGVTRSSPVRRTDMRADLISRSPVNPSASASSRRSILPVSSAISCCSDRGGQGVGIVTTSFWLMLAWATARFAFLPKWALTHL